MISRMKDRHGDSECQTENAAPNAEINYVATLNAKTKM